MTAIRYDLHFALLAIATIVYGAFEVFSSRADLLTLTCLVMGALHATMLVASLRGQGPDDAWKAVFFIALAAVWSALTFSFGMIAGVNWWYLTLGAKSPSNSLLLVCVLLVTSAIGSSGYWLMVRLFWLKSLHSVDWLRTVALCLTATFSVCIVMGGGQFGPEKIKTDFPWTVVWWFAFSLSLYWSETRRAAHKTLQSAESAS